MTKSKTRANGEGCVYQRKDGVWVATIRDGRENGRRRTVYGKTQQEALDKLFQLRQRIRDGQSIEPQRMTVGTFLGKWLEETVRPDKQEGTYIRYESVLRVHVLPKIGRIRMVALSPLHVTDLYADIRRKGGSGHTCRQAHAILRKAFKQAKSWGLVDRNAFEVIDSPKPAKKPVNVLTPEQVGRFLAVAKADRLYAMYLLAIASGMRQGELLGLQWCDIDWHRGAIAVQHNLLENRGKLELGNPKTASGRRLIDLPDLVLTALRDHQRRMLVEGNTGSFVFCDTQGGPIRKSNLIRRWFRPLLEEAGLRRMRFHDLRHTAATVCLSEGVPAKVTQERMGHSQISVTMDTYSHVLSTMQHEAATKLNEFLQRIGV